MDLQQSTAYGPNSTRVASFIGRVSRLKREDGHRIRHSYVEREAPPERGGVYRAEVTLRVIEAAVRGRRKDAHRQAINDCRHALGASEARGCGMGIHLGDLAGALVVRDQLDPRDFDFMAAGWHDAMGVDV